MKVLCFIILMILKSFTTLPYDKKSDNHLSHFEETEISFIPSETMLLERKAGLRIGYTLSVNEGKDITFQFFSEDDFVASFDSLYKGSRYLWRITL